MSRLLGDPVYESLARRAVQSLWTIRNNDTGLFGTNMNIQSGQWISNMSGMLYGYVQRVIRREPKVECYVLTKVKSPPFVRSFYDDF